MGFCLHFHTLADIKTRISRQVCDLSFGVMLIRVAVCVVSTNVCRTTAVNVVLMLTFPFHDAPAASAHM